LRRKLWLIDLTLLALVVWAGSALRDRWEQSREREEILLGQMVPKVPPPVIPPLPGVTPVTAVNYLGVAEQLVMSRDRNPTVILDPPPAPPPPKPMPSLPLAYGVIDLGTGPSVILSERSGSPQRGYRVGEQIGEFKLLAVNSQEILFEWDGKQVRRKMEEVIDKNAKTVEPPPAQRAASTPKTNAPTTVGAKAGPGIELGPTTKSCVPNDKTPAGTVQDGYRKVVMKTPFGESCRWEAVK
jgi:hypothetical protein